MRSLLLTLLCAVALPCSAQQELDFLRGLNDFREIDRALQDSLNQRAFRLLDERARTVAGIRTESDLVARGDAVRQQMLDMLGTLPDRTPLNAKVVETIEMPGYVIEKILFESQPGFFVTANLYRPAAGQGPFPAVLYPLGHEPGGKAYPIWQQMLVTLARKGYVALTWDPLGQGERVQMWDADFGRSKVVASTTEHTVLGIQCLLVGDNIARYTIWDGMRALDYLLSRPEVDPQRVAVTGNSGGGTHTAYLAALEPRLHVAAPSCFLTSWRNLLTTIGPQDAEQCLLPFLARGLDHADFIYAFAPRPYMMLPAIRDFFPIQGARATFAEAAGVYDRVGAPQKIRKVEADDGHGYSAPRRLAAYEWFAKWLQPTPDDGVEPEAEIQSERRLQVTQSGQVSIDLPKSKGVFELNNERLDAILAEGRGLPLVRTGQDLPAYRKEIADRVRKVLGYRPPEGSVRSLPFGSIERPGYRIEKLALETDPGLVLPGLLFVPQGDAGARPATLYVHAGGKSVEAGPGGAIEKLVEQGRVVFALDLRGWGETGARDVRGGAFADYFGAYGPAMTAFLLDDSLLGLRVRDVATALAWMASRPEIDAGRISAVGVGEASVPLLHAAVLDERLAELRLERMLISYQAVVKQRIHRRVFESVARGVLRQYDLPQLAAAIAPRPVTVMHPLEPNGVEARKAEAEGAYIAATKAYAQAGVPASFAVLTP
ncbi:MAG: prolyl oligopeptidase family serine peptidase [Acidobacteria bacterium]|nr:prolyl oligopeptidase family serine peptidase [Acidobacteriota bacterium]